jgi:hypothetical protein
LVAAAIISPLLAEFEVDAENCRRKSRERRGILEADFHWGRQEKDLGKSAGAAK